MGSQLQRSLLYRHCRGPPRTEFCSEPIWLLPSIQSVPATLWVFLRKFVPLSRLHCLGVRPEEIILVRLGRHGGLFPAPFYHTTPAFFLLEVLVDRHGREVMIGPEYAILHALALVEQRERLQGFSFFAQDRASFTAAQKLRQRWIESIRVRVFVRAWSSARVRIHVSKPRRWRRGAEGENF